MDGKPLHYDGSSNDYLSNSEQVTSEPFQLSDEMRRNISGNPFEINIEK